jgi:hypothetical protein
LTYLIHLQISKLLPEVIDCVETNESHAKETDPFDAIVVSEQVIGGDLPAYASDGDTRHNQPISPFERKFFPTVLVELRKTKHRRSSKEQQHRIQKDKSTNRRVWILYQVSISLRQTGNFTAEDHESDEIDSRIGEFERPSRVKDQGHTENAKNCVENAHEYVIDFLRILFSRLEFEWTIVSSEIARESDQHFAERGMNLVGSGSQFFNAQEGWGYIKVEFSLQVMRSKFPETKKGGKLARAKKVRGWGVLSFIPSDDIALSDLI